MPSSLTKTAMSHGHFFAFGNTEDRMLAVALGKKGRGRRDDGAFDPLTGRGYVKEQHGHYADALRKGHCVWVLIVESMGGIAPGAMSLLHRLERDTKVPGARDGTDYHRRGPRTFVTHALRTAHRRRRRARRRLRHRRAHSRCPLARRTRQRRLGARGLDDLALRAT